MPSTTYLALMASALIGCTHYVPDPNAAPRDSQSMSNDSTEQSQLTREKNEADELRQLREVAASQDPQITKTLIDVAMDPTKPRALVDEARTLLAMRRTGVEHMLAALGTEQDFLSNSPRAPVGPIADALAALGEKKGAPLLARALTDPMCPADDIERAAQALVKIGTAEQIHDLETFFELYRTTATEPAMMRAVVAAAKALDRIDVKAGQQSIARAISDPMTRSDIRRALQSLTEETPKEGA